jgi:hypothetical protein
LIACGARLEFIAICNKTRREAFRSVHDIPQAFVVSPDQNTSAAPWFGRDFD